MEQREPKFQRGVAKFGSNACNNTPAQLEDVGSVPIGPPIISSYEIYLKDCTSKLHPHCGDNLNAFMFVILIMLHYLEKQYTSLLFFSWFFNILSDGT